MRRAGALFAKRGAQHLAGFSRRRHWVYLDQVIAMKQVLKA